MKIALFMAIVFSVILTGISDAQESADLQIVSLKAKIIKCLHDNDIPGAAVVVASENSIVFSGGFGYAHVKDRIPVTESTHFWIGSISKSFTALGILKLVEQGRVDLNVPVKEILPEVMIQNPWQKTDPVRLVHLLEHTAGLCDGISSTFNWRHDPNIPLKEVMRLFKRVDVYHRPGSFYLYSNTGYLLAGMILERITGMKYEEFLRREFLIPLGMTTTTFDPTDPNNASVMAQGYGAGNAEIPLLHAYQRPAAHTYSSIMDMAHYLLFFLNRGQCNGKRILSPESLDRMETPCTSLASRMGLVNGYGLGNEWALRNQHRWRGHNGAGFGFYSDLWYNCDLGVGYVVLINQFDPRTAEHVRMLRELIAEHLTLGAKPSFQPIIAATHEESKKYCGTYTIGYGARDPLGLINYLHGLTIVRLSGDTLSIRQPFSGAGEPLFPVSKGLFRKQNLPEPTVAFFSTPEGMQAMVNGRDYLQELSPWKYWVTFGFLVFSILVMLSTIFYPLFCLVVIIYNKINNKHLSGRWNSFAFLPSLASMVLIAGFLLIANQEIFYLGKKTFAAVAFYVSTWLFVMLSMTSLLAALTFSVKQGKRIRKVFYLIVAITLACLSLFLWYWGIIGLKLWM